MKSLPRPFHRVYKHPAILLGAACIFVFLAFGLARMQLLVDLEHQITDELFRLDPRPADADSSIVLIAIDDGSLEYFNSLGISWPWPRSFYGYVVDYLSAAGARSVLFDMQFYEPDLNREESYGWETDAIFSQAISHSQCVFLAAQAVPDSARSGQLDARFAITHSSTVTPHDVPGVIVPIDTLQHNAAGVGIVNVFPDADGVIRRLPLLYTVDDNRYPQFSVSAWMQHDPAADLDAIPRTRKGNYLINWYGDGLQDSVFTYLPFQAVIASASARMQGLDPLLPASLFTDANVIIGATAAGLLDLKTSPYSRIMPGMEVWATVLSNLLQQDYLHPAPQWLLAIVAVLLVWLLLYAITHLSAKWGHVVVLLLILAITGLHYLLWTSSRIILWATFFGLSILIAYLAAMVTNYLIEGRSKREIRRIFTRYLHPDVIDQLVENPQQVRMGGAEIEATLLFTDIANFTTFSEGKTPAQLVGYLNEYLDRITGFVLQNDGLLDKYTGDGIMAIFGAPLHREDHALLACTMALQHRDFCISHADDTAVPMHFHRHTRIGIHSGKAVVGNIGSTQRMDYTAIGDTVNLAARLEGVNKVFGTSIIISEATWQQVHQRYVCRELDYLRVKGKTQPTRIYELIGTANEKAQNTVARYEAALTLYRQGNWQQALSEFEELAQLHSDTPSATMAGRCRILLNQPPAQWDGIFTLEAK